MGAVNNVATSSSRPSRIDPGLVAVARIAHLYRISTNPAQLAHQLALIDTVSEGEDLVRAARLAGLKAKLIRDPTETRLRSIPVPAIIKLRSGWRLLGAETPDGLLRVFDPMTRAVQAKSIDDILRELDRDVILVTKRFGLGHDPRTFGFWWFLPSIKRYRIPLVHVLVASLFVQLFALVTPLLFQIIIDKVLVHKSYSTLIVIVCGMVLVSIFGAMLKYLRTYTLAHTTNRIDVEIGSRLFHHLLRLPLEYFETRSAGVTVARIRELETIRNFLTGQGIFSLIDLLFVFIFIAVLFIYSWFLALVIVCIMPLYVIIAAVVRPMFRDKLKQKFNRWSSTQQFLVENVVGAPTLKAAAVEPIMQHQWEDRLAAYVRTSFEATAIGAVGQNSIEFVTKLSTALILLFGPQEVIEGRLSVGELIAFNMIANQVTSPILRISQLWQDFQQIQVSVERLGDILNSPTERLPQAVSWLRPARGSIEFRDVTFRYRPDLPDAVKSISVSINAGEVVGCRTVRLRQVDVHQAAATTLSAAVRANPRRRKRHRSA